VPSGRLQRESLELLRSAGFAGDAPTGSRSLLLSWPDLASVVLIAKPVDLLTYVERGAADCGIIGKDVLLEQRHDVYELLDLGFGRCRGVIALPAVRAGAWREAGHRFRIATKYPRLTEQFFADRRQPVEIIEMWGSVELAPRAGLADGILDLVMSGETLRANNLVEVEEVFVSTARLVVNHVSLRAKSARVEALLAALPTAAGASRSRP
jgi:ATP phosphoribosyltransferase